MFKRNCVVKYVDSFGVEHLAKVEAESLSEAAIRGMHRLDSSFWMEEDVLSATIMLPVLPYPIHHAGVP